MLVPDPKRIAAVIQCIGHQSGAGAPMWIAGPWHSMPTSVESWAMMDQRVLKQQIESGITACGGGVGLLSSWSLLLLLLLALLLSVWWCGSGCACTPFISETGLVAGDSVSSSIELRASAAAAVAIAVRRCSWSGGKLSGCESASSEEWRACRCSGRAHLAAGCWCEVFSLVFAFPFPWGLQLLPSWPPPPLLSFSPSSTVLSLSLSLSLCLLAGPRVTVARPLTQRGYDG
ncbi:hypothetical protein I7I53_03902 [Histoplasma capsulatum var. duboisii H88]|uniref:Uncharacterized protein n=1 Tax=Ajellomyces capsulatus (strain H88) TaxID=544711 RepID=A0A8A1LPP0_AJEC8|nr:hypothetical protein I7I53_03902 [Histoplasma capsulatum var. duboisii H88]